MSPSKANKRILIVDDDAAVRNTMKEYIKNAGYTSDAVSCAEEALDLLQKENFQVVITDIKLPAMGGLELTKTIKKEQDSDDISEARSVLFRSASSTAIPGVYVFPMYMQ